MNQPRNILDVYVISTMLASSSKKTVYRSIDPKTQRDVVVKLLTSAGTSGAQPVRDRFLRTMSAMQFLSLPAFPEILDFGFTGDNSGFIVMEWIDGTNLKDLTETDPQRVIPILIQVTETIEALAMGEVHHHNLSPDNIIVQARPKGETTKIVGLGTASYFPHPSLIAPNGHDAVNDRFIAPERRSSSEEGSVGGSLADLYSLALVTADVLGAEVVDLGSEDPKVQFPADIRESLPDPETLENTLAGSLALDPDQRQMTFADLKNSLEHNSTALHSPTTSSDPPPLSTPDTTETQELVSAGTPSEDKTVILDLSNMEEPINEDLIQTGTVSFDPNKTDPLYVPPVADPPELPPAAEPEPELPPPPPPVPEETPIPGATAAPPAEETAPEVVDAPPSKPPAEGQGPQQLLIWGAVALAAMMIIGLGIMGLWRLSHRGKTKPQPVAVVQPTPVPVAPNPEISTEPRIHPALETADALLLEGDIEGVRTILSAIPPEDIEAFSNEEAEAFQAMTNALEGSRFDSAVTDLKGGLEHGSIRMLKRGVAGVQQADAADLADRPDVPPMLKRGQNALRIHALMWKAHEAQDHRLVLEQCSAMIKALPKYSTPLKFREESALALEALSDQAFEAGHYDQARGALSPIEKYWPDRQDLSRRLSAIEGAKQKLETQRTQIAKALAVSQDGDPEAGLTILKGITPVAMLQRSHSEAVALLEKHRAELDAQPPKVAFKTEPSFEFKKKKTVTIHLIATDDHHVAGVSAFIKTADAGSFSKIDISFDSSTGACKLIIGPKTHKNDDFLLYVEAKDDSGHTGGIGSSQKPLEFKRKKGLKALFGK